VEGELVVGGAQRHRVHGLEHHRRLVRGRPDRGAGRQRQPGAHPELEERPRAAALVHAVVEQPRVAPHRDPPPGGAQVRLGGDRVLEVAQPVGRVGQQLHQRDLEVGGVPLGPARQGGGQPVEHQPAEALVVLGQIVELRLRQHHRRAVVLAGAVKVGVAGGLEGEGHRVEPRVEPGRRGAASPEADEPQLVGGEVAGPVDRDGEHLGRLLQLHHPDAAHAGAAGDHHVAGAEHGGRRAQQVHLKGDLVGADLQPVDPVERPGGAHHLAAPLVGAAVLGVGHGGHGTLRVNVATCWRWLRRTV
jgi:hypothetical protein